MPGNELKLKSRRRWPAHAWLGLALVLVFWWLNWTLDGMRTHWGFFPLWLGYCLVVDALVLARKASSLLTLSRVGFVGLFAVSVPAWWLFELINTRTANWIYLGDDLAPLPYAVLASLSFSTVIPAVLGTAELVILDVRTENDWESSELKIKGAVRADPSDVQRWSQNLSRENLYVLYCA